MPARVKVLSGGCAAAAAAVLIAGFAATPAAALPDSPVVYPSGAAATPASGSGFDTCTAPSASALAAWRGSSPYTVVNIYFGGNNRGCAQPNLTSTWVRQVTSSGWKLLPTYFGYQPSCIFGSKSNRYTATDATTRGTSDGNDAVTKAKALGLLPGSALYADVEHYDRSITSCQTAVRRYVSAWTTALHKSGYLAGIYAHQDSGIRDLADTYNSTSYARPDAVWMARWDGNASVTNWPTAANSYWANWQRAKQYRGDHNETWGGVTLNIDNDIIKAPVATVARSYQVTGASSLNARGGPGTSYPITQTYAEGASLPVVCQGVGEKVGTSSVWNRLTNGSWVSDYYTSTPSDTGFSAGLTRCVYPGQVTAATSLTARTGPGASYPVTGNALPRGAIAYVMCQQLGSTVQTTQVWNRLSDNRWVSDYYIANRSNTTWSTPVPRCP
ncbi:MAG TPA: glycoside hydrolase domain-containing protein [Microlunatus sp.]